MRPTRDLTGQRFGRLVALRPVKGPTGHTMWECRCDCGGSNVVLAANLYRDNTRSCGCLGAETHKTHGQSSTRLYKVWSSMKHRCSNPNDASYEIYGGRGIAVCDGWQSFEGFRAWASVSGYRQGLTLERVDADGNYEPGNCTWIPKSAQSNNTSRSRRITFRGGTRTLKDWAIALDVPYARLFGRLKLGWSIERAFTEPPTPRDRAHTRPIEHDGRSQSVASWGRDLGIPSKTIHSRLARGWTIEAALRTPVRKRATGKPVYVAPARGMLDGTALNEGVA